ncbi:hypothetical protein BP5796_05082 [Coleophoma crateriformis]|uniref:Uncharacterized protein n=1 Tax=Coleophoma crateriformis TaxID=565419 RepID=A0A3D8S2T1_9HELO|nr:hypothetical protein BP5796_05082 [Coleophoma crateriformis]
MDGISAASAVIQVVAVSLMLSQKIATFILDAKDVVQIRTGLYDQVQCLRNTVCTVHQVLERRQQQTSLRPVGPDEEIIYAQTVKALDKTARTVGRLEAKLEKLGGGRAEPRCWEKAWIQMKLQIRTPDILKLQRQIETNTSCLQLMLQCINPFIHEDTQAVVQTGFATTHTFLENISKMIDDLRDLMYRPLPGINTGRTAEVDSRMAAVRADSGINPQDIENEAFDIASECLSIAKSLCSKISQPGTFIGSAGQSIRGAEEGRHDDRFDTISNEDSSLNTECRDNEQGGLLLKNTIVRKATPSSPMNVNSSVESKPANPTANPPFVERLEILTDHIDNDHRMAIAAIQAGDYSRGERHISEAITTAKEREVNYNFPFEDEVAYQEILAYAKARNGQFGSAKKIYENILHKAEETTSTNDTEGRVCFALAQLHQDQYRQGQVKNRDEKSFDDWKGYSLRAYESAMKDPDRPDSESLWDTHPSLPQTAEMLAEMYECWGKPAKTLTYRQRHPSQSESAATSPGPPLLSLDAAPPTPPDSDGHLERQNSQLSPVTSIFADINVTSLNTSNPTAWGRLVLHGIEQNDFETTKYFLDLAEGSIDLEQHNDRGLTPLLLAVQRRHTEIVRILLEHEKSPDITAKDKNGWTVLHYALSRWEGEDMVEMLVNHGANVNAAAKDGTTPLHCAVNNNKLHGAKILLQNSVSTEAKDSAGRTPMYVAVQKKRLDMVAMLMKGGAVCDRLAWTKDRPDLKDFFEECEDNGIVEPLPSQQEAALRRDSILSKASRKSFFSRKFRSSAAG